MHIIQTTLYTFRTTTHIERCETDVELLEVYSNICTRFTQIIYEIYAMKFIHKSRTNLHMNYSAYAGMKSMKIRIVNICTILPHTHIHIKVNILSA